MTDESSVQTQNDRGEWVESIPLPFYLDERSVRPTRRTAARRPRPRFQCLGGHDCRRKFDTEEAYRGHYALVHILGLS